ncbi:Uncharacterized membrane protein [Mesonia phycicola]|uniref:Uncharacterized membrane protein n=1 Tax=Mesonia phycicola TaxID=579105 RepID=A0A1M6DYV0_9FLAO|nr:DUF2085 domain-containing protein [Mesonia phycicola]SHI78437.1 Uncharacterized membrane protein [Mesonia phycicola]
MKLKKQSIDLVFCHRKPERSFFWKGKQFPVCARCTGIHLGYLSFPLFLFGVVQIPLLFALLLIIPTYLDGFIQAYFNIESNNYRRFITGLVAGVASMALVSIIGIYLGNLILSIIN